LKGRKNTEIKENKKKTDSESGMPIMEGKKAKRYVSDLEYRFTGETHLVGLG
jgi:hypothetical protein